MVFGTGLERRVQVEGLASDGDEADAPDPVYGIPAAQVTLRQLKQSDKIRDVHANVKNKLVSSGCKSVSRIVPYKVDKLKYLNVCEE